MASDFDKMFSSMQTLANNNNSWSAQQAAQQMDFQSREADEMRTFNMSEAQKERDWSAAQAALTREYNSKEAATNRDWQEMMSNSAHQREVEDLKKAGLNPVLSAGGQGASVTSVCILAICNCVALLTLFVYKPAKAFKIDMSVSPLAPDGELP